VPVDLDITDPVDGISGIHGVTLTRASGKIVLERLIPNVATLRQPDQPDHDISLPRRSLRDCLAEELRRLDPDDLYGEVIRNGLGALGAPAKKRSRGTA
jgi:glucose-6-phosphate dehydrogenase assembly protein OpcA